jgi:transposase
MAASVRPDPKSDIFRKHATLNPHPERVKDPLFLTHPFFDPRDLVQVKYELLHRVLVEGQPVGVTAAAFGFSRTAVHKLRKRFEAEGLAGLMPRPKGPQRASKLSAEVMAFIWQTLQAEPELRMAELPERIYQRFGISIHGRSIKRALKCEQKKECLGPACQEEPLGSSLTIENAMKPYAARHLNR